MKNDILSEMEHNVKTNSFNAWLLAARPRTLTGAAVPVMIGVTLAYKDAGWEKFRIIPAILCFLFAFIMQIDANFINDYFDCLKGNDDKETRLGPQRACSEGWITLHAMRWGLFFTSFFAAIIGVPLIYYGGMKVLVVGIFCMIFCFLYTTTLSYWGLGDLLVVVFFGIVPVCISYYVILPPSLQSITSQVFTASIACGLVIDTLLVVNNYRDRENDRRDKKLTLIVRIGEKNAELLYCLLGGMGVLLICIAYLMENNKMIIFSIAIILPYLYVHGKTYLEMKRINHGKGLNRTLSQTARNMFIFGILSSIGFLFLSN